MEKHCVAATRLADPDPEAVRDCFKFLDGPVARIAAQLPRRCDSLRRGWMILPGMPFCKIRFDAREPALQASAMIFRQIGSAGDDGTNDRQRTMLTMSPQQGEHFRAALD